MKFVRKRILILLGGGVISSLFIMALVAALVAPHDYAEQSYDHILIPPGSPGFPLGTDEFGRCILSRILFGARISIQVGLVASGISLLIGVPIGAIAGYYGGRTDMLLSALIDATWGFPLVLLALMLIAILGPGLKSVTISLGMILWSLYARVTRGQVLSLREKEFVEAARAIGVSNFAIISRHILPNCLAPILVVVSLTFGQAILVEGAMSFLGIGAQPPAPSWGSIISGGRQYLRVAPWITTSAGVAIMIVVLGFNLLGDGLRDMLDPRLRER
ncbi:MAG: ABC transporter permease [Candidatus Thorarchaeota archaeon]